VRFRVSPRAGPALDTARAFRTSVKFEAPVGSQTDTITNSTFALSKSIPKPCYKQYTGIFKIDTEMTCYRQYTGVLKIDTEIASVSLYKCFLLALNEILLLE
jgi:hypothetical protein